MKTMERPNFAWNLAFIWLWVMTHTFWRVTVLGRENLPRKGAFILAPNHVSWEDPPLIAFYLYPRPVHYWTKVELSSVPVLGWVLRHMYTIPIKRGTVDRGAIDAAVAVLTGGNILGSFPEGSRHSDEVKKGSAFIARRASCPIVPCGIVWKGRQVIIRFGQPIPPDGTTKELTSVLEHALARLH